MAVVLVTAACSSPTGTDRAPGYFEGLRPVARGLTGAIAEIGQLFDEAYESQTMLATRLTDLRAASELAIAADRAQRLEPGSVYQADHDHYLGVIAEVRDLYRGFDEAVATGDIARAAVAAVGMEMAAGIGFSGLAAEYCGRVTFDMSLCNRPIDLGTFDALLHTMMLDLTAGYLPLMRPAPAALDPKEAAIYLEVIDTAAVEHLERVSTVLAEADPPSDRLADRDTLLAMLEAAAIVHRSGGEHSELPDIFCRGADDLSEAAADLAALLFTDDDLDCGV